MFQLIVLKYHITLRLFHLEDRSKILVDAQSGIGSVLFKSVFLVECFYVSVQKRITKSIFKVAKAKFAKLSEISPLSLTYLLAALYHKTKAFVIALPLTSQPGRPLRPRGRQKMGICFLYDASRLTYYIF